MRVLHTSDWHIGRALYGRKRYEEFEGFLSWLVGAIGEHKVDVLLVAGDIFDTNTPSNRAQELYYRFLCRVATSGCRHVVVVAGNHDSPSFLNAPRELLKALSVHVVGSATVAPGDEVLVLRSEQGVAELIVCAVPYLRDRDIRVAEAGEGIEDKEQKLVEGIRAHYTAVGAVAEERLKEVGGGVPVVGMGHLFTTGGERLDDDGVRNLYIGTLSQVGADVFPVCFDYLALGHLHIPQRVGGSEVLRYSGSPLPMGFGEAKQQKSLCLVEFDGVEAKVELITVPVFQRLERIRGDWEAISKRITELAAEGSQGWLEVVYEGDEVVGDLRERLEAAVEGTRMEIIKIKNSRVVERVMGQSYAEETLDDLSVDDVFERCLAAHEVVEEQRAELRLTYQEVVASINEEDVQAE